MKTNKYLINLIVILLLTLTGCKNPFRYTDSREIPVNADERVQKNIEEGRGFRLMGSINKKNTGEFDFASSNELWRASLDTLDFMPLALANYSGGVIVTDWYSDNNENNESVKISVRFLTNEIRSDALDINVFLKKCSESLTNCSISKNNNDIVADLNLNILKKATKYQKNMLEKRRKNNPYVMGDMEHGGSREKPKKVD